jgi:2-oxo-4-hydroxy-4-carboxy-5-ureidoimidazoline decarboxylase
VALTLAELNRLDQAAFTATLGSVFEASPWVAAGAFPSRPFASLDDLHEAMARVARGAPRADQLALLREHPDLAGKLARTGAISAASVAEQASVGLDALTEEEARRFDGLNRAYRERFGFPFIIAVRHHTRAGILAAFERRLAHTADEEIAAALVEVVEIARLRLADRVTA